MGLAIGFQFRRRGIKCLLLETLERYLMFGELGQQQASLGLPFTEILESLGMRRPEVQLGEHQIIEVLSCGQPLER